MKVGIVYDLKESYHIDENNTDFEDFSSLKEISGIKESLENNGYITELIGNHNDFAKIIKAQSFDYDLVFNMSEGFNSYSREALVPALCELMNIPCTFSNCHAMSLTLDKHQTLLFAKDLGIQVPNGFLYNPFYHSLNDLNKLRKKHKLDFPIVCKPNYEGTSMGITISKNEEEFQNAVVYLTSLYNEPIRCDEYIDGREIAIPIIGTGNDSKCMGIVEYQMLNGEPMKFFTNKYKRHGYHKSIFADYGYEINSQIQESALSIHQNIPCFDLSRIDMRLHNGVPYLLEVTPLPDLTKGTTFERSANRIGLSFDDLIDFVIKSTIKRRKAKND